jgi:hypothetical protein
MTDWNIAPPALTHPNVVAAMRAAPPLGEFNEAAALQRMQRVAFLRSIHEKAAKGDPRAMAVVRDPAIQSEVAAHNARIATYAVVKTPAPPPLPAPMPPPVTAITPQAPRAAAPAVPQTPALAGVSRRAEMLTSLLGARPAPTVPTDKNLV